MTDPRAERPRLRFSLIGEGLLLSTVCAAIAERGHEVVSVFTTNPQALAVAGCMCERTAGPPQDPEAWLLAQPCDVLLSVNNPVVLSERATSHAAMLAVNYHDSPLPAYAGLRATAWAIYNGEKTHGVTWHSMTERIDQGDILVARRIDVEPDETTETLNRRCTQAAITGFQELLTKLEAGEPDPMPPPDVKPSYYGHRDRLPGHGMIDWSTPAFQIERAVRAATWGPVENDFGSVRLFLANGHVASVLHARLMNDVPDSPPGTVASVSGRTLAVSAVGGCLELAVSEDLPASLVPGSCLAKLGTHGTATSSALDSQGDIPWVVQRIVHRSQLTGEATAISGPEGTLTYRRLDERSSGLAAGLRARGVAPGAIVGVALASTTDVIVSLLGILKAGAAFLVLEESAVDRLGTMIAAAAPAGVIADRHCLHRYERLDVPTWGFGDLAETPWQGDTPARIAPDSPAYVVFTSGSSGVPKGVQVGHGSLAYFLQASSELLPVHASDRVFQLCSLGFDSAIEEVFSALTAGATLCLRPRNGSFTMAHMLDHHEREGVTVTGVFASRLCDLLQAMEQRGAFPPCVRRITTGGEEVNPEAVRRWKAWFRSRELEPPRLINVYGLTETTIANLYQDLAAIPEEGESLYFGTVLPGTLLSIRDPHGRGVPREALGELWIGGPGVAHGYLGPGMAADGNRFVEDGDQRWYRTGDRFRQDGSGRWEFHGRLDDQLKILGYRIEPKEIEAACLSALPVSDCAVMPVQWQQAAVLACILLDENAAMFELLPRETISEYRKRLEDRLPPAMTPTLFYRIPAWPRSSAGKLDQRALQELVEQGRTVATAPSECTLAQVVQDHLRVDIDGLEAVSLFDLGIDSLGLMALFSAIEARFGAAVSVERFLHEPTLAGLARLVGDSGTPGTGASGRPHLASSDSSASVPVTRQRQSDGGQSLTWIGWDAPTPEMLAEWGVGHVQINSIQANLVIMQRRSANVDVLAAHVADFLTTAGNGGPHWLGGFSFHAVLAHAIAVELHDRGESVPLVFLLSPTTVRESSHAMWRRRLRAMAALRAHRALGEIRRFLSACRRRWHCRRVARAVQQTGIPGGIDPWPHLECMMHDALSQYRPRALEGDVTLVFESEEPPAGWKNLATRTHVAQVSPCDHADLRQPPYRREWLQVLADLLLQQDGGSATAGT